MADQRQDGAPAIARCYIVELELGVYLAPWNGDPGRTLNRSCAATFDRVAEATEALAAARLHRAFARARILRHPIEAMG